MEIGLRRWSWRTCRSRALRPRSAAAASSPRRSPRQQPPRSRPDASPGASRGLLRRRVAHEVHDQLCERVVELGIREGKRLGRRGARPGRPAGAGATSVGERDRGVSTAATCAAPSRAASSVGQRTRATADVERPLPARTPAAAISASRELAAVAPDEAVIDLCRRAGTSPLPVHRPCAEPACAGRKGQAARGGALAIRRAPGDARRRRARVDVLAGDPLAGDREQIDTIPFQRASVGRGRGYRRAQPQAAKSSRAYRRWVRNARSGQRERIPPMWSATAAAPSTRSPAVWFSNTIPGACSALIASRLAAVPGVVKRV